jgi:choline dehydrogenase-like flavoprotein
MASCKYDIVTVGGGLGGAALAKTMTEHGARVLVLERERQFKDRVRGEGMHAWGVPEARALGIYDLLRDTCGCEARWWDTYLESAGGHANNPSKANIPTRAHLSQI